MAVTPPAAGLYPGEAVYPNNGNLWPGDTVYPGTNVWPGQAPAVFYFTPPHRGQFVPESDPRVPGSMQQPWRSLKNTIPRGVNLWLGGDGLLHEEQPVEYHADTKMFYGGAIYGPLSQADIDLLSASGYGAYLTENPKPVPQP